MATHSSMFAWEIPWTEETGGLQSMGSQRVGQTAHIHTHTHTHQLTNISWDLRFGTTCLLKLFTMIICLYIIHASIIALKNVSL